MQQIAVASRLLARGTVEMNRRERGDTLVEMLVAFAILSLVLVGTMMVMNKGVRMSQESIERTLVRQQMDSQLEMVRYIHDTNPELWRQIKGLKTDTPMSLSSTTCPSVSTIGTSANRSFFMAKNNTQLAVYRVAPTTYSDATAYAQINYASSPRAYGIWIQIALAENLSRQTTSRNMNAYDVYAHACWYSAQSNIPVTLGTIARIYDQQ